MTTAKAVKWCNAKGGYLARFKDVHVYFDIFDYLRLKSEVL